MDQITQFIINHWALCSLFAIVLLALIFEEFRTNRAQNKGISPQDLVMLLNHEENIVLIDIRSTEQFKKEHILAATSMPISTNVKESGDELIKKLTQYKHKQIVLADNDGTNSPTLAAKLQANGYAKITLLNGGITAWKTANLPLTSKNKEKLHD